MKYRVNGISNTNLIFNGYVFECGCKVDGIFTEKEVAQIERFVDNLTKAPLNEKVEEKATAEKVVALQPTKKATTTASKRTVNTK